MTIQVLIESSVNPSLRRGDRIGLSSYVGFSRLTPTLLWVVARSLDQLASLAREIGSLVAIEDRYCDQELEERQAPRQTLGTIELGWASIL
jgi:hypothetical protein